MKKIIKNWGTSLVINFNSEDAKIHELEAGDVIEFTITSIKRKGRENKPIYNKEEKKSIQTPKEIKPREVNLE